MARQIVRFTSGESAAWGFLDSQAPASPTDVITVNRVDGSFGRTRDLLHALEETGGHLPTSGSMQVEADALLSPVTRDATVVCQGLNYSDHAAEAGHNRKGKNLFFPKTSSAISGPYQDIIKPAGCTMLDYEVEIGILLRKEIDSSSRIEDTKIGDWVAAVTLCNDVSARDEMFGAPFIQWLRGKGYRTFCPTGPVLYWMRPDEVGACLENLDIRLSMNGEVRQSANSANWVFRPPESLRSLAEFTDMQCGDMILTGTPGGVIAAANPAVLKTIQDHLFDDEQRLVGLTRDFAEARFLKDGDVLELEMSFKGNSLGGQHTIIRS